VDVAQRDVWWANLGQPAGAVAGYHRPVIIVQSDGLNASRAATYLCVPLTGNLRWEQVPTNLRLSAGATGLERDSIAQVGLLFTVAEVELLERVGRISEGQLKQLFARLDLALGRG
jgi:mRNA interferase MazF